MRSQKLGTEGESLCAIPYNCTCQGHGRWLAIYRAVFYIFSILEFRSAVRRMRKPTWRKPRVSPGNRNARRKKKAFFLTLFLNLILLRPGTLWRLGLSLLSATLAMRTHEGTSYQKL